MGSPAPSFFSVFFCLFARHVYLNLCNYSVRKMQADCTVSEAALGKDGGVDLHEHGLDLAKLFYLFPAESDTTFLLRSSGKKKSLRTELEHS